MAVFVRVVEAGSFSAAARLTGTSQSNVSKQVAALESVLGVRLLQRTTRSVKLTEDGANYYEAASRALAAANEADAGVGTRKDVGGLIRVTAPLPLANTKLIPVIAAFLARHPDVSINLALSNQAMNLVSQGIDVAVRVGASDVSSTLPRRIGTARRLVVGAPAYLDRAGRPDTPAELSEHRCLTYSLLGGGGEWRFTDGTNVRVEGPLSADSPEALRAAALAGMGLVLSANWLFDDDIACGRLEKLLPDWEPEPMAIHAVLPSDRHVAARTRLFVDFIADALAADPLLSVEE